MIKFLRKTKNERAQTMVEFAIVFPILLLITYGLIEFGRMIFIYAAVTNAAREGARYGAAAGYIDETETTKYYMDCEGIETAAQRGAILAPIQVRKIEYDNGPGTSLISSSCPPPGDSIHRGDRIVVSVTGTFAPIIPFLGLDQNPINITRQNSRTILVDIQLVTPTPP